MAAVYDRGRAVSLDALTGWRDEVEALIDTSALLLDVGSGTGLWAAAFVQWFGVEVIAMEPSARMRAEAVTKRQSQRITYIGGRGEEVPLRDDTCGCAWLSTVVHHLTDMEQTARELRRVLHPGSPVLIRNAFAERCDGVSWLRFWPHAREIAKRRWPTVEAVASAFAGAGFRVESITPVLQQSATSLSAYRDRLRTRADSTLVELSDEDFESGMRALEEEAAMERLPHPVVDQLDLLVLR